MSEIIEVLKINDKEYRIGQNKITLLEPDILFVESIGVQTDEVANCFYNFYTDLLSDYNGIMHVIIDINKSKKSSPSARRTWKTLGELEKTGKVALYGLHPVAKVLAAFVIRFTQKDDFRFFSTKEEAFSWIKG